MRKQLFFVDNDFYQKVPGSPGTWEVRTYAEIFHKAPSPGAYRSRIAQDKATNVEPLVSPYVGFDDSTSEAVKSHKLQVHNEANGIEPLRIVEW